jgi:hypothetical protein
MKSKYAEAYSIHTQIIQRTSDQDPYIYAFSMLALAELDVMIGASKKEVHRNLDKVKAIFNALEHPSGLIFCEILSADLHLRE